MAKLKWHTAANCKHDDLFEGYEYYMYRKGAYYFRNETEKVKKVPDMSDQLQFDFYNAVRSRGYGVRYKFISY